MRAIIYLTLAAVWALAAVTAWGAEEPNFYVARGFAPGHCYRHPAIRRCKAQGPAPLCTLELFASRTGALTMPLGEKNVPLIDGKATTDFGIFRFEIATYDAKRQPVVRILDIEDVPLRTWDSVQDGASVAHAVDCAR